MSDPNIREYGKNHADDSTYNKIPEWPRVYAQWTFKAAKDHRLTTTQAAEIIASFTRAVMAEVEKGIA